MHRTVHPVSLKNVRAISSTRPSSKGLPVATTICLYCSAGAGAEIKLKTRKPSKEITVFFSFICVCFLSKGKGLFLFRFNHPTFFFLKNIRMGKADPA
jgi:hypothetical protein